MLPGSGGPSPMRSRRLASSGRGCSPPSGLWAARRLRPRLLTRRAALAVEDLLEDLAHARPQQVAGLGAGVVIAPSRPGSFARVEVGLIHRSIVCRPGLVR